MLTIDRKAIESLPPEEQAETQQLLDAYEEQLRNNPLIGYRPHPKQVSFHDSQEPLKAFLGGNRSGKTTAGILDDLIQAVDADSLPDHLKAYKKWQPPFYCRIIVPDFTSTMEGVIFQKLREWAPKSQLVGDRFDKAYEKSSRKLRFKNGSIFDFLTFEQDLDKFGGAALHRVHYDEQPPRDIRRESMMRLIDYGGDEVFTLTPMDGMSAWMYDEIWLAWQKDQLPESTIVVVDMDDNPYLDEKTKARALAGLSKEERQARKSGRFVSFSGIIYEDFNRSLHVIPEIGEVPSGRVYVGIDPGMRHMAAVIWTYLTPEDTMVIFDELALQGHTIKQVCDAIKKRNDRWGQKTQSGAVAPLVPSWYVIDPAARNVMHNTGRSDQAEYVDHRIVTILGQNDVIAGINRVRERLQAHRLLVCGNCPNLIDEFRKYRWSKETRTEDEAKQKPVKADDHLLDALRYVVASRPYSPTPTVQERNLSPLERAAREDQTGKRSNYNRRPPSWQFA
jgi:phage terminase large subunit-like protein